MPGVTILPRGSSACVGNGVMSPCPHLVCQLVRAVGPVMAWCHSRAPTAKQPAACMLGPSSLPVTIDCRERMQMRSNHVRHALARGEAVYGFSAGLGSLLGVEILARTGIDFILVEQQHGAWGDNEAFLAFMAIEGGHAIPMTRVSSNDYTKIGRMLDQGALGIIVPMVDTADQAKAAADACHLPPAGTRSWGFGRARTLGGDYAEHINDEVLCMVQIESATSVENAEAILATPGVHGCWAGPSDLALSMGIHPSEMGKHDSHHRALERIVMACRNTGKSSGIACNSPEEAVARRTMGFQFLTAGSDSGMLTGSAATGLKLMRGV